MGDGLPVVTAKQLQRALQKLGWYVERQTGSHLQMRHPDKPGLVTITFHTGTDLKPKTLSGALKQAGITAEELRRLL